MAAARLAMREGAEVTIFDSGQSSDLCSKADQLSVEGCNVVIGNRAMSAKVSEFEFAVISPGISLEWEIAAQFSSAGISLVGEIEFAFPFCSSEIIGVTGTNGKTTTVELIERMLIGCGESVVAGGNYGRPFSDIVCDPNLYSSVVLEISSFQLESIQKFHPHIGVWMNFAPDHLDRYSGIDEYRAAKMRLFVNQNTNDWAVVNGRDHLQDLTARTVTFSAFDDTGEFSYEGGDIVFAKETLVNIERTNLRGKHNAENLMAAIAVARIHGHEVSEIAHAVSGYSAPPHRCELVSTISGVEYINDSKATNLHALESALVSLSENEIVLIAGGKDKGLPFESITECVSKHVNHVVLIGEIRSQLASQWGVLTECRIADDIEEAVKMAADLAGSGVVLFSPGTSSYDMFSNYRERGQAFRDAVKKLNQPNINDA